MKDFIAGLMERGLIERVIDSRFLKWTKGWEGEQGRRSMQLPSVFPINLGQRPSNEAPTDRYEYVPLDRVADEIRSSWCQLKTLQRPWSCAWLIAPCIVRSTIMRFHIHGATHSHYPKS
jgi:hypothetical protein